MTPRKSLRLWRDEGGASTVEFVLVLPLLALMVLGTVYLCFMLYAATSLHYAVEDAARCSAVDRAICADAAATQTYALSRYRGPTMTPALTTASFAVSTAGCGKQVAVTNAQYQFRTGIRTFSVPISARACYPA